LGDDNWVTVAGLSVEEMGVNDFEVLFILV
jgi:hypothetical protein